MSSLRVRGGIKLSGEITPQGAKNEALQQVVDEGIRDQMTASEPPKELTEPEA